MIKHIPSFQEEIEDISSTAYTYLPIHLMLISSFDIVLQRAGVDLTLTFLTVLLCVVKLRAQVHHTMNAANHDVFITSILFFCACLTSYTNMIFQLQFFPNHSFSGTQLSVDSS